jgi:hypothetical protein
MQHGVEFLTRIAVSKAFFMPAIRHGVSPSVCNSHDWPR